MIVQQVVRSIEGFVWEPGFSNCYKDTSYTKTKKKVRFKFDRVEVKGDLNFFRTTLLQALEQNGHKIDTCHVYDDTVLIWQEFPIQVIEGPGV